MPMGADWGGKEAVALAVCTSKAHARTELPNCRSVHRMRIIPVLPRVDALARGTGSGLPFRAKKQVALNSACCVQMRLTK